MFKYKTKNLKIILPNGQTLQINSIFYSKDIKLENTFINHNIWKNNKLIKTIFNSFKFKSFF
jgi:hypothetical protein